MTGELENLWKGLKKLEGQVVRFGNDNISFAHEAKSNAKQYELLYHCCSMEALLSIVKNKEFWLSNLTCVNDDEECESVDVAEFKILFLLHASLTRIMFRMITGKNIVHVIKGFSLV